MMYHVIRKSTLNGAAEFSIAFEGMTGSLELMTSLAFNLNTTGAANYNYFSYFVAPAPFAG